MEFVASFIEIIFMIALLIALVWGVFYCARHRTRIGRWVNNYASKDNEAEKDYRIRELRRKQEDAEAEIARLNAEASTEASPGLSKTETGE